jgi:hypothetical protein
VPVDRVFAEEEPLGHLAVAEALGDQFQHLALSPGQGLLRALPATGGRILEERRYYDLARFFQQLEITV